jgi:hypothetical protein
MKRQMAGGEEYDAFTGWRKYLHWHKGQLKKVKRRSNKRERRKAQEMIRNDG